MNVPVRARGYREQRNFTVNRHTGAITFSLAAFYRSEAGRVEASKIAELAAMISRSCRGENRA